MKDFPWCIVTGIRTAQLDLSEAHMHRNILFRTFMRHLFAPIALALVAAWVYYAYATFSMATFTSDTARFYHLLVVTYGPLILALLIVLAQLVIRRHYDRLSETRAIIDRAGGQAYVEQDLARLVRAWKEASDADSILDMDRIKLEFARSADWYKRMEFKVQPFHTYA